MDLVEKLAHKAGAMDGQVAQQICMQEAGQIELVAPRTSMERLGLHDGDGRRCPSHRWIKQVAPWADASADAYGLAVQPQEQADLISVVSRTLPSFSIP